MSTETSSEAPFEAVCRELAEKLLRGEIDPDDLEAEKLAACSRHGAASVPKHTDILDAVESDQRGDLEELIRRKPVRTASGVSPIAIMTSPKLCPHGKCLYCPGGPASEFSSAQSYTGHEPAAARGKQNDYDPYGQVTLRLEQLREIGHPVDKAELILMGGTMTARSHDYQEWFVKRAIQAMNDYDPEKQPAPSATESFAPDPESVEFAYLEDVLARNETAAVRNVATTFETKPDWCDRPQVDRMLRLGGTKVEVGVQTTFEEINRAMHRGHGTEASVAANRRLRDAGFKVGFHMMPGQPGMSLEMCREDFRRLWEESPWRPDYLKIYPTLVVKGTRVYDQWKRGDFEPLDNETAAELVAEIKRDLPPYVRLQRVQRDIPADFIEGGVWKSNLRQLARKRMEDHGWTCDCIRCREVGHSELEAASIEATSMSYEAAGGTEHFLSFEDQAQDLLVGFTRLRFPGDAVHRPELEGAALIRELHVYGQQAGIGADGEYQHRGFGRRLIERAERRASEAGYEKLAILSGIGVRPYYREKLGYVQDGPYVSTSL